MNIHLTAVQLVLTEITVPWLRYIHTLHVCMIHRRSNICTQWQSTFWISWDQKRLHERISFLVGVDLREIRCLDMNIKGTAADGNVLRNRIYPWNGSLELSNNSCLVINLIHINRFCLEIQWFLVLKILVWYHTQAQIDILVKDYWWFESCM